MTTGVFARAAHHLRNRRGLRFLVVGGGNTFSGYLVSSLLYFCLHTSMPLVAIILISTVVNVTVSFTTNKMLVFQTKGNILREYFRFYLVSAVPIAISFVLLPILVSSWGWNPYVSIAIVTGIGVVASYFGHTYFSFVKS